MHDLPVPQAGDTEILVRVTVAGVNPIDWKMRDRDDVARRYPFVLGQDFAGIVVDAGAKVTRYTIDDRVFGIARGHGAYAERTVVPEESHDEPIAKIPDDVSDADAAALPTAGLTALAALAALDVKEGTSLLILGAAGGVGHFASQIARAKGAKIVGTVESGKEEFARSSGVDEVVAYDREDVVARVKALYPDGVDAVLDLVDDGDGAKRMAASVREGGKFVSTIGAADQQWFAQRRISATNLVLNTTAQSSHAGLRELAKMIEAGTLKVRIVAEFALADAAQALERSKAGKADGKIVIDVS